MQKTVLITGASRGIGAATARAFARAGYRVAVHYHTGEEEALSLCRELEESGAAALPVRADVAVSREVANMVDNVLSNFHTLDTLVCNAGISLPKLFTDYTDEDWRTLHAVNLDGVFYACRAALPHMIHRKQGQIVTVSSMWGVTGGSCEVAYSSSKAAVIGLTKALAKEVGPSGITVNCIAPGVIDTRMNAALTPADLDALKDETPLERLGTPEDVAGAAVFLASPAAAFITGQVLSVNGGIVI